MITEKIKNYQNPIVFTLLGGVALLPIQNTLSHSSIDMTPNDFQAKIIAEQHVPHAVGHHFNDFYVDPRSIRAIGQDAGKSDQRGKNGRENWDAYAERLQ